MKPAANAELLAREATNANPRKPPMNRPVTFPADKDQVCSAGEGLSSKFENVTFAEEVIEDAPALDQQPSIQILAPWHPYQQHLASRTFYDWQGGFWFATDFCVKDMEIYSCDGSDYDYIVAKQTAGNGEDGPEVEYTLTSFRLSGSSAKIDPIDVTEDLTEEDADGMIAQNADWSVKVAPKLLAYDSAWALDEFEKASPGLIVGRKASSAGAIVLHGSGTLINDITYTVEWDSGNFEVTSDSQALSSPYTVTAETPRDFGFSIHAKEQANHAASTTFRMKAEVDDSTVGDDEVKVCLLPVDITIRKQGEQPPEDGVIVKRGDVIEIALAPQFFDTTDDLESLITWQYRQLKCDGSYTEWASFGPHGTGTKFEHTTDAGGIFQLKAIINDTQEFIFVRKKTDIHTSGDHLLKKGDPDSFGVTDTQKQIDIRDRAKGNLGSTAYAAAVANGYFEAGINKCNLFVAEKAQAAGATVPYINFEWYPLPPHSLPPVANQWAGIPPDSEGLHPAYTISGWDLLEDNDYPQPGFIVASGWEETWATGHAGIVDYEGRWISAGSENVNRNAEFQDYRIHTYPTGVRPAGKRKYTGN